MESGSHEITAERQFHHLYATASWRALQVMR